MVLSTTVKDEKALRIAGILWAGCQSLTRETIPYQVSHGEDKRQKMKNEDALRRSI